MTIAVAVGWFGLWVLRAQVRRARENPTIKHSDLRAGEAISRVFLVVLLVVTPMALVIDVVMLV